MQDTASKLALLTILLAPFLVYGTSLMTVEYIIYPQEQLVAEKGIILERYIKSFSTDPQDVYASERPGQLLPIFWITKLTEEDYQKLKQNPWGCHYSKHSCFIMTRLMPLRLKISSLTNRWSKNSETGIGRSKIRHHRS